MNIKNILILSFISISLHASNDTPSIANACHQVHASVPEGIELEVNLFDKKSAQRLGSKTKSFIVDGHEFKKKVQQWLPAKVIMSNATDDTITVPVWNILHDIKLYSSQKCNPALPNAETKEVYGASKFKKKPWRGHTHPFFYASIPLSVVGFGATMGLMVWLMSESGVFHIGGLTAPFGWFFMPPAFYGAAESKYKRYLKEQQQHGGTMYNEENKVVQRFNSIPSEVTLQPGQRYEMVIFGTFSEQESLAMGTPII